MTAKKTTKAPSKTASASSKRLQNSTKPSDEQKTEQTVSTEETENQNPSSSTSNQSSQTETSDPQTISSTSDDDEENTVAPDEENDGEDGNDEDGNDTESDDTDSDEEETEAYRPVGAPSGRIIRQGDDVVFDADRHETYAVIKEDVYQEVHLRGSKRVSYRLIYSAGTAIPLSALEEK